MTFRITLDKQFDWVYSTSVTSLVLMRRKKIALLLPRSTSSNCVWCSSISHASHRVQNLASHV